MILIISKFKVVENRNRVLRRILGAKTDDNRGHKRLHNEVSHYGAFSTPHSMTIIIITITIIILIIIIIIIIIIIVVVVIIINIFM